jgi:predicted phosphodiesterase
MPVRRASGSPTTACPESERPIDGLLARGVLWCRAVRLVLLSDTHNTQARIVVPDGDVLIHAGDSTKRGTMAQLQEVAAFLRGLPHRHKIIIAGNHDFGLQEDLALGKDLFGDAYLLDSEAVIDGVRIWGSPWQPWFYDWAFNLPRGEALREKWAMIPDGIDVLVTHGPPQGLLDRTVVGENVGCEDLLVELDRVRPRLHVFGHIHEAYGTLRIGPTLYVNASNCTLDYDPENPAIVVDLPTDRSKPATLVEA